MRKMLEGGKLQKVEVLYDGHRGWTLNWNNNFKVVYGSIEEFAKFLMKVQAKDNFQEPRSFRSMTYQQIAQEIANGSDRTIWVWERNLRPFL